MIKRRSPCLLKSDQADAVIAEAETSYSLGLVELARRRRRMARRDRPSRLDAGPGWR